MVANGCASFTTDGLGISLCGRHAAFAPDGRFLAIATEGPRAHLVLWDWSRGFALLACECLGVGEVTGLAWMGGGETLAIGYRNGVIFQRVSPAGALELISTRELSGVTHEMRPDYLAGLATGPASAGGVLFALMASGTVLVLDKEGRCLDHVPTCAARVGFTAVAVNAAAVYCAGDDGSLYARQVSNLRSFREIRFKDLAGDGAGGAGVVVLTQPQSPAVSVSPCLDGRFLACTLRSRSTVVVDAQAGALVFQERAQVGPVECLASSPASEGFLAAASSSDQTVAFHSEPVAAPSLLHLYRLLSPGLLVSEGSPVGLTDAPLSVLAMAVRPRSPRVIALGSDRGIVWLVDARSGRLLSSFLSHGRGPVVALEFSSDGYHLACTEQGGRSVLFRASSSAPSAAWQEVVLLRQSLADVGACKEVHFIAASAPAAAEETFGAARDADLQLALLHDATRIVLHRIGRSASGPGYSVQTSGLLRLAEPCCLLEPHRSGDYVLACSRSGLIEVIHIVTGQSRGFVDAAVTLPDMPRGRQPFAVAMCLDPTGLYVAVGFAFSPGFAQPFTRVSVMEVGTGMPLAHIERIPAGTSMTFSPTGRMICVATALGVIIRYRLPSGALKDQEGLSERLAEDPGFWREFPIFLEGARGSVVQERGYGAAAGLDSAAGLGGMVTASERGFTSAGGGGIGVEVLPAASTVYPRKKVTYQDTHTAGPITAPAGVAGGPATAFPSGLSGRVPVIQETPASPVPRAFGFTLADQLDVVAPPSAINLHTLPQEQQQGAQHLYATRERQKHYQPKEELPPQAAAFPLFAYHHPLSSHVRVPSPPPPVAVVSHDQFYRHPDFDVDDLNFENEADEAKVRALARPPAVEPVAARREAFHLPQPAQAPEHDSLSEASYENMAVADDTERARHQEFLARHPPARQQNKAHHLQQQQQQHVVPRATREVVEELDEFEKRLGLSKPDQEEWPKATINKTSSSANNAKPAATGGVPPETVLSLIDKGLDTLSGGRQSTPPPVSQLVDGVLTDVVKTATIIDNLVQGVMHEAINSPMKK